MGTVTNPIGGATPTYFKFFEDYNETIKSCKSKKDAGILILAMIDFWETGQTPTIPDNLADKWRCIRRSLNTSRVKAHAKLRENRGKNGEKNEDFSSGNALETSENTSVNQEVEDNLCAQCEQSVLGTENIDYRTQNKEQRTENIIIDSMIDDSLSINDMNSIRNIEGNEREMPPIPISIDDYDLYLSQQPSDNPTIEELEMWDSGATITNPTPAQQNHPTQGTSQDIEEAVFQSICNHYHRAKNRPVTYTRRDAEKELGLEPSSFYQAIQSLVNQGRLKSGQVEFPDRTLPTYVPSIAQMYLLPELDVEERLAPIKDYFQATAFAFNKFWKKKTFITINHQIIETASETLGSDFKPNDVAYYLTLMVQAAFDAQALIPA